MASSAVQGRSSRYSSALIVDDSDSSSTAMTNSLRRFDLELWLENDFDAALKAVAVERPDVVITELKLGSKWAFDFLARVRDLRSDVRLVIATHYASVATAVLAIRLGVDDYFVKPVDPMLLLEGAECAKVPHENEAADGPMTWPSLDRTIWEHLNQVFVASGSMSEAARRLGLNRRSLRRMLNKYPPLR